MLCQDLGIDTFCSQFQPLIGAIGKEGNEPFSKSGQRFHGKRVAIVSGKVTGWTRAINLVLTNADSKPSKLTK